MEWLLALICMMPAAVSDFKYRNMSLESCVAALLVGVAAFAWWALSAPVSDVISAAIVAGGISVAVWAVRRRVGSGDWWFMAGACAAVSTIDPAAAAVAVPCGMVPMIICQVLMCARRPGLPWPRRLVQHVKLEGDRFRMDVKSRKLVPDEAAGMVVAPGLPMVTFMVGGALAAGVVLSL